MGNQKGMMTNYCFPHKKREREWETEADPENVALSRHKSLSNVPSKITFLS